jgi:hypothetical protein
MKQQRNNKQNNNKTRRGWGRGSPQKAQMMTNTQPIILLTTCTRPPGVPGQKHISDLQIMTSFSDTDD